MLRVQVYKAFADGRLDEGQSHAQPAAVPQTGRNAESADASRALMSILA